MSRVAKAPLVVPEKTEITIQGEQITVKGPKGTLQQKINKLVEVKKSNKEEKQYIVSPTKNTVEAWAQAGTVRALINNMFVGVNEGFKKTLELVGVGYRAQAKGNSLTLTLGYSHPVEYNLPEGVTAQTPNNTTIELMSIDKQILGQAASEIRSFRKPEPYKGKGVKYQNEQINKKEAKKK